jgi:iron complex outermembrane recepter protein
MNLKFLICFSIMMVINVFVSNAENKEASSKDTITFKNMPEVTVTGQRLSIPLKDNPSAVTIVTEDYLKTMPKTIAIDDAVNLVPGIRVDNQANGTRVHLSIRGMGILTERGIHGIKVLIDGIPLNDPTGFVSDLYDIDWNTVKTVELLRGPSAAIYGGSSNGGIINIFTKDGEDKPVNAEAYTSYGSNNFWKAFTQVSGKQEELDYRLSLSRTAGDGFRIHSAFWGNNISEKINWVSKKNVKITQLLNWTESFSQNPEGICLDSANKDPKIPNDDAIPKNEFQLTRRLTGGLVGTVGISDNSDLQFNTFLRTTYYKEAGSRYMWHRNIFTPGGSLQYNMHSGNESLKNHFSVGTDFQYQNMESYIDSNLHAGTEGQIIFSNDRLEQTGLGIFIDDRIEFWKNWGLTLSLRYDKVTNTLSYINESSANIPVDLDFDKVTSKVGLSYSFIPELNIYANVGQGFLPPTTEGLVNNPDRPGGVNKYLNAATSIGEEIGFRGLVSSLYYDLNIFYMTSKDDFNRYRLSGRPMETFYQNLGDSRRLGFEVFIGWTPIQNMDFRLAYTYNNFKYVSPDSINGNWLPNSPEHKLNLDLQYKMFNHLTLGAGFEMQSLWHIFFYDLGIPNLNQNLTQDGFSLINARIIYDWEFFGLNGELSVYGKNLTDEKYMGFTEPDDGGNCYQPAAGRQFFGSLKLKL